MTTAQIEQSEVRDAAQAMLAALIKVRGTVMDYGFPEEWGALCAAIATAQAAGIRVKD